MNTISDFYDELDLKYPEIGIAMQDIDRLNPGSVKFIIPVLTPNLNSSKISEQTAYQNDNNLKNANKNLEITNLKISNYIEIKVPKELCAVSGGEYIITGGTLNYNTNAGSLTGKLSGIGSVWVEGSQGFSVDGSATGAINLGGGKITGRINLTPVDRYIKKGSKWIIVFVGGDITKPQVISRYYE